MGGIRFKIDPDGPFLSDDKETAAPPWATLRTLEEASRNFENDESGLSEKWLNQLIKPGSSLGGARPAVYGAQRSLFRFRTAAFRNQTVVLPQSSIRVNGKG